MTSSGHRPCRAAAFSSAGGVFGLRCSWVMLGALDLLLRLEQPDVPAFWSSDSDAMEATPEILTEIRVDALKEIVA